MDYQVRLLLEHLVKGETPQEQLLLMAQALLLGASTTEERNRASSVNTRKRTNTGRKTGFNTSAMWAELRHDHLKYTKEMWAQKYETGVHTVTYMRLVRNAFIRLGDMQTLFGDWATASQRYLDLKEAGVLTNPNKITRTSLND